MTIIGTDGTVGSPLLRNTNKAATVSHEICIREQHKLFLVTDEAMAYRVQPPVFETRQMFPLRKLYLLKEDEGLMSLNINFQLVVLCQSQSVKSFCMQFVRFHQVVFRGFCLSLKIFFSSLFIHTIFLPVIRFRLRTVENKYNCKKNYKVNREAAVPQVWLKLSFRFANYDLVYFQV